MSRLTDRVAIITGAGRGIGRATALRLAADGACVVVNDVDADPAEETVALVEQAAVRPPSTSPTHRDLDAARGLVAAAVQRFGKLDIVVNNAGTTRDRIFHNLDDELFDVVMDVNSRPGSTRPSPRCPTSARWPSARSPSTAGRPTTARSRSRAAWSPSPATPASTTTPPPRARSSPRPGRWPASSGPFGINVNAVAPGFIETRLTAPKSEGEGRLRHSRGAPPLTIALIALGRLGQPEEVANAHAFLVSSDADYISGVTLPVTGGQLGGMG
jgi:3-oxoacyl-[acyl-carrier protein] reductase